MSESRNLTYLITGMQYGGATIGMTRLLSELHPNDFDVTVVTIAKTSPDILPLIPEWCRTRHFDISSARSGYKLVPIWQIIAETDVLVCSLFHASAIGVPIGRVLGVPTLVWQHNMKYKDKFRSAVYTRLYRLADHVLADSERVKSMLISEKAVPARKVSVLPIAGVDPGRFRPQNRRTGEDQSIRVGTVGRLVEQKGYPELIECAQRLGNDLQFHVVGTGPLRESLEESAPGNVRFHGSIDHDDLPDRLASFDIYFQPSRHEGLCMTVIEAMSCGLPFVASSVGGITESVVDGVTGLTCEPRNVDCFCCRINQLARDAHLRSEMGKAGRDRVIEHYSADVLGDEFRNALARVSTGIE